MWRIYDTLLDNLPAEGCVKAVTAGSVWNLAQIENGQMGLAMTTQGNSIQPQLTFFSGFPLRKAAQAVKSWNLEEASGAMAVINACYNTYKRLEAFHCYEPYERYCTYGLDLAGKTIGVIGHLKMPNEILRLARDVYILERSPQPGDYPDTACEFLLPKCDVVLITGSTFVNKTLPRLLELCKNAYTIVTGPTVPLCPELLGMGIQRLAGMVVTDPMGVYYHVASNRDGSPYPFGKTFLLEEGRL